MAASSAGSGVRADRMVMVLQRTSTGVPWTASGGMARGSSSSAEFTFSECPQCKDPSATRDAMRLGVITLSGTALIRSLVESVTE
mmetsp:Transcript_16643/g.45038  ORF Transcript_16643/g.45038 Transcript_16643/m.45038 type:complete len:85 (-) Transcript_16643:24-278(-)